MSKSTFEKIEDGVTELVTEVYEECNPLSYLNANANQSFNIKQYIHIPYLPALHRPGWMVRYILGPYDEWWAESLVADIQAGLTVLMTLIPQALSQAQLAGMPPIYGLYTCLIPSSTYTFFGSSMQLTVGTTALISLMTGTLLTKYEVDADVDVMYAVDTCAQAAFCVGIIILGLGFLNMGHLINFMSEPVMLGFTTGAALTIGLTQLRGALGFSISPPQVGDGETHYNYEVMKWWHQNFNGTNANGNSLKNHYAVSICVGVYVPLIIVQIIKWNYKPSKETKKTWPYKIWNFVSAVLPLVAIIIAGAVAYDIKKDDNFNDPDSTHSFYAKGLKIVGVVEPGLDVLRIPHFRHPMGQFFADVLPITLIAFMESYSIARSIGAQTNTLHLLNASQEMLANGIANLVGCVSSGYPVSGSFSRSALNAACGARTPLSISFCILGVIIVLTSLTNALQFIPNAALSAVIFVAISNIIHITPFWHAWKYSKKDFFTMLVTMTFSFVFETSIGLAIGLATSVGMYLIFDIIFAKNAVPTLYSSSKDGKDVDVVRIGSDLNFLTSYRVKDFISALTVTAPEPVTSTDRGVMLSYQISSTLDSILRPNLLVGVEKLPKAIVVDVCMVKTVDITGLEALESAMKEVRSRGVLIAVINMSPDVEAIFKRYGIKSDKSTAEVNFKEYEMAYRMDLWNLQDKTVRPRAATSEDIPIFSEQSLAVVGEKERHHIYEEAGHEYCSVKGVRNEVELVSVEVDVEKNL